MQKKDVTKQIEYFCEKGGNDICPFSKRKCLKIIVIVRLYIEDEKAEENHSPKQ